MSSFILATCAVFCAIALCSIEKSLGRIADVLEQRPIVSVEVSK